jgi:hypothetical protein
MCQSGIRRVEMYRMLRDLSWRSIEPFLIGVGVVFGLWATILASIYVLRLAEGLFLVGH